MLNIDKLKAEGDLSISPKRREWLEGLPEYIRSVLDEDAKYFIHQSLSTPCLNVVRKAYGSYIEDYSGKKYLDFHGNTVHNVGFSNPRVIKAIKEQIDDLSFCPRRYTNIRAIELAKRLVEISPMGAENSRVLFAPGGAEAIEMAYDLSVRSSGKIKTVSWWDSFHGATMGAKSIGGEAIFRAKLPVVSGTEHVPPPYCYRCPYGHKDVESCNLTCAEMIKYVMDKNAGDVAAVIAEPIRGAHVVVPPKEYWKIVKEGCEEEGAALVFDEILSGLGRTGKMFACEHYDIVPDILAIGKSLGGGIMPIAGIIARKDLAEKVENWSIGHFTHEKNPVCAAAGIAVLDTIKDERLVERADVMGRYAMKRMDEMKERHRLIGDVRGVGLFLAIELVRDREKRTKASDEAEEVMYKCFRKGLAFKTTGGNILSLMPPLTISREEMDVALDIIESSIEEVENKQK